VDELADSAPWLNDQEELRRRLTTRASEVAILVVHSRAPGLFLAAMLAVTRNRK
jgi:hypothetical protein